jgi:hypothetical protein
MDYSSKFLFKRNFCKGLNKCKNTIYDEILIFNNLFKKYKIKNFKEKDVDYIFIVET